MGLFKKKAADAGAAAVDSSDFAAETGTARVGSDGSGLSGGKKDSSFNPTGVYMQRESLRMHMQPVHGLHVPNIMRYGDAACHSSSTHTYTDATTAPTFPAVLISR